jgi:hypothetical protein
MVKVSLDSEIMDFAKELNPSTAFLIGFDEYAGKLFIASQENIRAALRRIGELRSKAESELQKKVLDSIETALLFDEPQPVLEDIVFSIFIHLIKEGTNDAHLLSLLDYAMKDVAACKKRYSGRSVPAAVKALTLYRIDGITEVLNTVKRQSTSPEVKEACDALKNKVAGYVNLFELDGWGKGEFENVEKIFKREGFDLGRKAFYPKALHKALDYEESPGELENESLSWIKEELPKFRRITEKLAKQFGCEPTAEEVEKKIIARTKLDPKRLVGVANEIRGAVQTLTDESVCHINPKYTTRIVETPSYLTGMLPSAAAMSFDGFTKKPYQLFFMTTDPKRDPEKSVAGLINTIVHEEYGHCVHHSNSEVGFVGRVPLLSIAPMSPLGGPISEGLAFNREVEFLEVSKALEQKKVLTRAEKGYVRALEKYGGLKQINLELEFMTRRWRMIRFLRVLGDVWVNTGKRGLIEFVDWAHEHTGVPRSAAYFQLFPAHEGGFPGYATSYAVEGEDIARLERKIKDRKKKVKFSTYLCSIGSPPRSIYNKMLREYAAKL